MPIFYLQWKTSTVEICAWEMFCFLDSSQNFGCIPIWRVHMGSEQTFLIAPPACHFASWWDSPLWSFLWRIWWFWKGYQFHQFSFETKTVQTCWWFWLWFFGLPHSWLESWYSCTTIWCSDPRIVGTDVDMWHWNSCIDCALYQLQFSWTSTSWSGDGARAFSLMLYIASLLGIPVLIIENVANLLDNPEFKEGLMNRLKANGYSCILQHAFAAVKFLPIHRTRLILIAYFNKQKIGQLEDWKLKPKVDATWSVKRNDAFLMPLPPSIHRDVQVEPDILVEYTHARSPLPASFSTTVALPIISLL